VRRLVGVQIDHLVYGAPDLDAAIGALEGRLGVRAAAGGRHVGIGTHNALVDLGGGTYLEVIAPDPEQPDPASPRPFGLDGLTEPRLVGWAVATQDIDAAVASARRQGFEPGDPVEMHRVTAEGAGLRWRLTLNAIAGGAVPFLIAWGETEHPSRGAPHGLVLESFEIAHPDPGDLRPKLAALGADVPTHPGDSVALIARIRGPKGTTELR
jgi:hypothetical protein